MLLAARVNLSPSFSSQTWIQKANPNRSIFSYKAREEGLRDLGGLLEAF